MQTYPGGIMSGLDYYMNDRGLVVCETTIAQTKFDADGIPLVDRIRRALQYGDSIDQAVAILQTGQQRPVHQRMAAGRHQDQRDRDVRAGHAQEPAVAEQQERVVRRHDRASTGAATTPRTCNVRLETVPALDGRPANVVFHPSDRDRTWLRLFDRKNKAIDADFGFQAFTTPPLAASHSLDAKFTTTAMARELETWAKFGPPLGRTWEPTDGRAPRVSRDSPARRQRLDGACASTRRLRRHDRCSHRPSTSPGSRPCNDAPVEHDPRARLARHDPARDRRRHLAGGGVRRL